MGDLSCMAAMTEYLMLNEGDAGELGLTSMLVLRSDYEAAVARKGQGAAAAAADAAIFEDGPQEPQEAASEEMDVSVEAGVARKPRRARKPAPGDDAGQFIPDNPATPDVNEAYEPAEA